MATGYQHIGIHSTLGSQFVSSQHQDLCKPLSYPVTSESSKTSFGRHQGKGRMTFTDGKWKPRGAELSELLNLYPEWDYLTLSAW